MININEIHDLADDLLGLKSLDDLTKSCPRCGKASANKSNPAGRCSSCLKKLKTAKKTPGHWQRAQTKFDDLKRRENGKNGTASKKTKGRIKSRKEFVGKFKSDEKKIGEKLSPDRKDNSAGYGKVNGKSNVRNIKESLNRGRHKVDSKKLAAWKKRVKKSELTKEDLKKSLENKVDAKSLDEVTNKLWTLLTDE